MGIQGLTRFINERFNGWQPANLRNLQSHRLIIDGNNVCYKLYKNNYTWFFGGEYDKFSRLAESFLREFKSEDHVVPIVVFDGASNDDKKMDTVRNRRIQSMEEMKKMQSTGLAEENLVAKEDTCVLPVFLISVFMDVLRRLDIEFHVVDVETDNVIAALANHLECPVLASDSDYFIFQLEYGFIHFDRYYKNKRESLFNIGVFMSLFSLQEYDLCLVLPMVFGNDFIKPSAQCKSPDVYKLRLEKLAGYNSCKMYMDAEGNDVIREKFKSAKKFYTNLILPLGFFDENAVTMMKDPCISPPIPDWVLGKFKRGLFPSYLLSVYHSKLYFLPRRMVEVIKMADSWKMSRYIRQFLYGFVEMPKVKEIIRRSNVPKLKDKQIEAKFLKPPVNLNDPIFLNREVEKLSDIVLCVLKCHKISPDDIKHIFNKIPSEWKLPIAATFYWYRHLDIPLTQRRDLVKSLLLIFLECFPDPQACSSLYPVSIESEHLTALHAFGQWQCVYYDVMALNYVAREPFPATSPASLYSGRAVMFFATMNDDREREIRFIREDLRKWELFNIFLYLVTGLDENGRRGKHVLVKEEDTTVAASSSWTKVLCK